MKTKKWVYYEVLYTSFGCVQSPCLEYVQVLKQGLPEGMNYTFPIRPGTLQKLRGSLNFLLDNPFVTCSLKAWTTSFLLPQRYEQVKSPKGIPSIKWALFTHTLRVQGRDIFLPSYHRLPLWWSHAEYIHCNFCCPLDVSPIMWQIAQYPSIKFR